MMRPNPLWRRYARLFGADPSADVRDELQFHVEAKIDDLMAEGLTPESARRQAERDMGDLLLLQRIGTSIGEKMHNRQNLFDYWDDCARDIRHAVRTLRRDPGFATVSIVILALAIGANIAVFSVVNTLLLRPLPFPNASQLLWIAPPPTACGLSCATYSADAFEELRARNRTFQDITGYEAFSSSDNLRLTGRGEPQSATGIDVIGNFFQVLGVQPARGRLFSPDDDVRGGPHPVTLLTDSYWRRQFNADPGIVGRAIELNGALFTVVGVLPASFDFGAVFSPGSKVDLFTPLDLNKERDWGNIVTLTGRLRPGATVPQALNDLNRIAPEIYFNVKYPDTKGRYKNQFIPTPLKDHVTGQLRRALTTLWCAVGTILLIAGVNLSNLLLARAGARAKEFAVRNALGSSRGRTIRQLLIESVVLSGAGAALGLSLAFLLITWLAHQGSIALPLLSTLSIDGPALAWTILMATLTTLLFGLLPALRIAGGNLQDTLKDSGAGAGLGRKHERLRATLVVSEVALACLLLVSAGLLLRSFLKVLDVNLGFEPDHAASIQVDYDDSGATFDISSSKRAAIFQEILRRVSALPGVRAAGMTDYLPLGPNREWDEPVPQGKTFAPGELPDPLVYVVTPGFIRAMGIRLRGRDFAWSDTARSQRVVLINASAAHIYWPGEEAVGKVLMRDKEVDHVVGVVDDVHEESVEGPSGAQIYYPATQQTPIGGHVVRLVLRTSLQLPALGTSVMHVLRELNPKQPSTGLSPIRTIVEHANSPRRFFMILVGAFATLGLLLAGLGIYGVISYSVSRKTQEIGVRMALGAQAERVRRDVLLNTLRLSAFGILAGAAASFASARLIASLLFATSPWDVRTYAGTALLLVAVALAAGYLPARRASSVDPITALRTQ